MSTESAPASPTQSTEVLGCRREFAERAYARCGKPAEYIIWGKLFPKDALGPRCYDCAHSQIANFPAMTSRLDQYAIYKLPAARRLAP